MSMHLKLIEVKKLTRRSVDTIKQSTYKLLEDKDNANDVPLPSIQMSNITCNSLQYLIEDCLLNVFSLQSLDLIDLCSLAETCKRFKAITKRVIGNIGNQLSVRLGKNGNFELKVGRYTYTTDNKHEIERIFKNFGSYMSVVTIRNDKGEFKAKRPSNYKFKYGWVLYKVLAYRKYSVENVDLTGENFYRKTFNLLPKLMSHYTALKTIHLYVVEHFGSDSYDIVLEATDNTITSDFSTGLKSIFEKESIGDRVRSIGSFESCIENLQSILRFRDIRALRIKCGPINGDLSLFESMIRLRKLELKWCEFTDASHLVGLIRGLMNLEELTIVESWPRSNRPLYIKTKKGSVFMIRKFFELDEETFSEIVRIVSERPNVLTLNCQINFDLKNFDKDDQKVKINVCIGRIRFGIAR